MIRVRSRSRGGAEGAHGESRAQVVDRDGNTDPAMAHTMREVAKADRRLSRAPTSSEWSFLIAQRKERGYRQGLSSRLT